jgi:hypothetical protein
MFNFESPNKSGFNSNLSYGCVADAYINELYPLASSANTATARLKALEAKTLPLTS